MVDIIEAAGYFQASCEDNLQHVCGSECLSDMSAYPDREKVWLQPCTFPVNIVPVCTYGCIRAILHVR